MSACFLQYSLLILCCVALLGCSQAPKPDTLPYRLDVAQSFSADLYPADLDSDGHDELVYIHTPTQGPAGIEAIWIKKQGGQTIEQVNYSGRILPPHFLDLTGSSDPEILVPYARHDSLFLSVLDRHGKKHFELFLIDGSPRRESTGLLPWDPAPRHFYAADTDRDGTRELVTVMDTGFARLPRGILIHHLPSGRPGGAKIVGAAPRSSYLDNFDGDPSPEVVVSTMATNNGAQAGGFDDQHAYLIAFDLGAEPTVAWSKTMAENWSIADLAYADFDGNGKREFLSVVTSRSSESHAARLELIEPATGRTLRQRTLAEPLRHHILINLNRDPRPEIITLRAQNEIWALDHQFQLTHRRTLPITTNDIRVIPDLDGDGFSEMVVFSPSRKKIFLLSPDFRIRAMFQPSSESQVALQGVLQRGLGTAPHLLVGYDGQTAALRLTANSLYWFHRYGSSILWGLGAIAAAGGLASIRILYRRNRLLSHLQTTTFSTAEQGMLVIDPDGKIVLANASVRKALHLNESTALEGTPYDEMITGSPQLVTFLRRIQTTDPPRSETCTLSLPRSHHGTTYHITAEPVLHPSGQPPHWLIILQRPRATVDSVDARTWAMMAQKVTHDIKNPLTNILLTTQRLQSEYRKRVPHEADALDRYAERIIDRVHHLRQLTKQFMKILDVDALDRVKTDLATLLEHVAEVTEPNLPPTVALKLDLSDDLPAIRLDRSQTQTALENLVSNAIHALPDGGTITLSAYMAPALRMPRTQYTPADYAVIEVQDNGVGIAPDDRPHLFEPGFTTSEFGTGLGLALVRYIVERHDGFIEVESTPKVGSVFALHFPVTPPDGTLAKQEL